MEARVFSTCHICIRRNENSELGLGEVTGTLFGLEIDCMLSAERLWLKPRMS